MARIEMLERVRKFKELQMFIRQLEDEAEEIKATITAEMEYQQLDTLYVDVFTVKYTSYQSSRVDTTALKKELPDVAEQYTKISVARRFSVV